MGIFALTDSIKEKSISATAIPVDRRSVKHQTKINNIVTENEIDSLVKLVSRTMQDSVFGRATTLN